MATSTQDPDAARPPRGGARFLRVRSFLEDTQLPLRQQPLPPFAECFSDAAIIAHLCRVRVRQAARRHQHLFHRQVSSGAPPMPTEEFPDILPPRRQWSRFRNRRRDPRADEDENRVALERATQALRRGPSPPAWALGLEAFISGVRRRALGEGPFRFRPPAVHGVLKDAGKAEYRPIARFGLEDQVIEGITARHLRALFDPHFHPSSLAFRCPGEGRRMPTHHDAVSQIEAYRRRHLPTGLHVAECDIRGFFDCVDHAKVREALGALTAVARRKDPRFGVDPRALVILDAYLEAYDFPRSVRRGAEARLREKDPRGRFGWPEAALREFHPDPMAAHVGIPQGGALSGFLVNVLLHAADDAVARCRGTTPGPYRYLRYCDDMVILSPDPGTCRQVFDAYREALARLHLPVHPPASPCSYGAAFWEGKTKAPYRWTAPCVPSDVPWIQFVGYQVRHDGRLRIRPKSLEKHRAKVLGVADRLLRVVRRGWQRVVAGPEGVSPLRLGHRQILHRLRRKLAAMAVGRRRVGDRLDGILPRCWATGFRAVRGARLELGMLRDLDRHRERQVRRVQRGLARYPDVANARAAEGGVKAPRYLGHPFSYVAQFRPPTKPKS